MKYCPWMITVPRLPSLGACMSFVLWGDGVFQELFYFCVSVYTERDVLKSVSPKESFSSFYS